MMRLKKPPHTFFSFEIIPFYTRFFLIKTSTPTTAVKKMQANKQTTNPNNKN